MSITAFFFVFAAYARYPLVSSDYWEQQAGPRDMIGFFVDNADQYDEFLLWEILHMVSYPDGGAAFYLVRYAGS